MDWQGLADQGCAGDRGRFLRLTRNQECTAVIARGTAVRGLAKQPAALASSESRRPASSSIVSTARRRSPLPLLCGRAAPVASLLCSRATLLPAAVPAAPDRPHAMPPCTTSRGYEGAGSTASQCHAQRCVAVYCPLWSPLRRPLCPLSRRSSRAVPLCSALSATAQTTLLRHERPVQR